MSVRHKAHLDLKVAHWIHDELRPVSIPEAAKSFGVSTWQMEQIFSRIRTKYDIFVFHEHVTITTGGQQTHIRILHILPYEIDEVTHLPKRTSDIIDDIYQPLTWRDLLCRRWSELSSQR